MKKLLRTIPVLLLALGVMIAGIGGVGAQDQLVFSMVSPWWHRNPFWVVVIKGMEDACALCCKLTALGWLTRSTTSTTWPVIGMMPWPAATMASARPFPIRK